MALRADVAHIGGQTSIDFVNSKQIACNALVQFDELAQERRRLARRIIEQLDKVMLEQRRRRDEALAVLQFLRPRRAKKVQCQIDGGATLGHVVLQISIEPLIPQIELRGQANQKHVTVKGS